MRKVFLGVTVVALLLAPILLGQKLVEQKQLPRATSAALLARGKYLVEDAGLCGDCHTPLNEKGEPVEGRRSRALLYRSSRRFLFPTGTTRRPKLRDFPAGRKTRRSSF